MTWSFAITKTGGSKRNFEPSHYFTMITGLQIIKQLMAANIIYTICSSHSTCTIRKKNYARKKYFLEFQKLVSLVEEYMLVLTISKCLLLKLEKIWVILLLLSNKTFFYKNFGILVGCISISLLNGGQNWNSCNRFLM